MTLVLTTPDFEHVTEYHDRIAARADRVRFIDVPACRQFAVDGSGPPGGPAFQPAFKALYPVAYTLHFALKRRGIDAPVGAIEGLFWQVTGDRLEPVAIAPEPSDPDAWRWSLRLQIPDLATEDDIEDAIDEVARKKDPPALARLNVIHWTEGPSAQILHVGPYDAEPPTIERLRRAIEDAGCRPRGVHHEIYVSDPGRTAPERLKTVIRQPVEVVS